MARQATHSTKGVAANGISHKNLKRIWAELPAQTLVERLRQLKPTGRWSASGKRLTGCCPYHNDRTPSFNIYLDRGYAKCFGCGVFVWNAVDFWAHVTGTTPLNALGDLRQNFGLSFLTGSAANQFRTWDRSVQLKTRLMALCHRTLMEALNNPNNVSLEARKSAEWLTNVRKIPLSAIPTLDFLGIMPPLGIVLDTLDMEAREENIRREREADELGVRPDLVTSLSDEARVLLGAREIWNGSVALRYDLTPNTPGRIKLRRPNSKEFIYLGADGEEVGFFGLGWNRYAHLLATNQQFVNGIHLVEGEMDAMSLMAHQIDTLGAPTLIVVGSGGSGTASSIDDLYSSAGVEELYLVSDSPQGGGDPLIQGWLPHIKNLRTKVFCGWDAFPLAKDPDEAVLQYGVASVADRLSRLQSKDCFQTPQEWVYEHAAPEIEEVDYTDVRRRIEVASGWGRLLRDSHECEAYVQMCSKLLSIPAGALSRQIVALGEDEPAFIQRLANLLSTEFFTVGQKAGDGERRLYLWHKARKTIVQLPLADERAVERELGVIYGPIYQFFSDRVGIPPFLEGLVTPKEGPYVQRLDQSCRFHAKAALMLLAQQAPEMDSTPMKAQGIHVIRGDAPEMYIVNGKRIYHGWFEGAALKWKELEGPSHGGHIFDVGFGTGEPPWLASVDSVEDLKRAEDIDLRGVYDRIKAMLDVGWRFKHHQSAVKFLAAHIIAASVGAAFKRQPMVGFHADSQTGKSKLAMGLIGGKSFPRIHILSAAVGMDQYTPAGVRQYMGNKARPLVLDEFEDEGGNEKKTRVVRDILEMFRNLTGEDNSINYGSRSGEAVRQSMNMFVFVASIRKPDKVQDVNRMIPIELMKGDVDDPVITITEALGDEFIADLKRDLDVALLPHVKNIQAEYGEVAKFYGKGENRPKGVEPRFMEALVPALTVMKILGEDHQSFAKEFCVLRKDELVNTTQQSETAQLVNWIFESPQIPTRNENGDMQRVNLLSLLSSSGTRRTINSTGVGVYYDDAQDLLVVNWNQALQTLLRQHPRYSRDGNVYGIRELANRHETALRPAEVQQSGVISRLRKYGLAAMNLHSMSVFRVGKVLGTFEVEEKAPNVVSLNPVKREPQDDSTDYFREGM